MESILTTKLIVPECRPQAMVERARLVEQLERAVAGSVTLLSAPAGYGKTTLLAAWAAQHARPVCWYSLDENDNDVPCFFRHLAAGLQPLEPTIGDSMRSLFQPPLLAGASEAMSLLINRLTELRQHFVLVLDDYHLIEQRDIHNAVSLLLARKPAVMHVVLSSRADPPFSLARLRGSGLLAELRLADLRFSAGEAQQFLTRCMHLPLTEKESMALQRRTEGWAAGLQMAALSMQGRSDLTGYIASFTGSNRFILDYLLEEVLQRQPQPVQEFLLCTSILPRLCAGLCSSLLPGIDSRATLEVLERSNLFLLPLDDRRTWYRYHHLFADLLRQRLESDRPERVPGLHRRASDWFEENRLFEEAIDHALAAADHSRAARLLEQHVQQLLMDGRVQTLQSWLEHLPEDVLDASRELCLAYAWVILFAGQPLEKAEERIRDFDAAQDESLQSRLDVLKAYISIIGGEPEAAAAHARRAIPHLPAGDFFLRDMADLIISLSHVFSGRLHSGQEALDELARLCLKRGNIMMALVTLGNIAEIHIRLAQLPKALRIYEKAYHIAVEAAGRHTPLAGEALCGMGEIRREWNELEQGAALLEEGIELARHWQPIGMMGGYLSLARLRQAQGDEAAAVRLAENARELALQYENTTFDDVGADMVQARLYILQGRLAEAQQWARQRHFDGDIDPAELDHAGDFTHEHLRKYEYLVAARLFIRLQQFDRAAALLEALLQRMPRQGRTHIYLEALMLHALLLQAQGEFDEALRCLQQSLELAEVGAYMRLYLDEGRPMAQLLHEAARRDICPAYTRRLLSAFPADASRDQTQALIEPLSERELEVLQLLDSPATNRDIADRLFISTNTVKKHVARIMAKLSAANRRQAVNIARSMGLLREK